MTWPNKIISGIDIIIHELGRIIGYIIVNIDE